jgi:hypothetical protein
VDDCQFGYITKLKAKTLTCTHQEGFQDPTVSTIVTLVGIQGWPPPPIVFFPLLNRVFVVVGFGLKERNGVSLSCTETWNRVCLFVWASCDLMDHDAGAHEVCKLLDSKEIRLVTKLAFFQGRERERERESPICRQLSV